MGTDDVDQPTRWDSDPKSSARFACSCGDMATSAVSSVVRLGQMRYARGRLHCIMLWPMEFDWHWSFANNIAVVPLTA